MITRSESSFLNRNQIASIIFIEFIKRRKTSMVRCSGLRSVRYGIGSAGRIKNDRNYYGLGDVNEKL
jgi:hypothetical protein